MQIDFTKRIFGLDIMRAVAILLVVASHALWIVPDAKGLIPDLLSLAGMIGVEIFFVLSGYLIGRIIYRFFVSEDFNFNMVKYFWVRRWFRTLPNYYFVLIINILLAYILGSELPENLWHYFLFLQNFIWEIPLFFTESWSLPIEEFAYIIGPLLMYLLVLLNWRISKSKLFVLVTILIILFFTITKIIYNQGASEGSMIYWNLNLKSVTIYRIDAIYYGVFAAYLSMINQKHWKKFKELYFIIGAVIFIGLNYSISAKGLLIENYPFFWNVLYLPINSIAIACTLPLLSNIKTAPKLVLIPITVISLISYSMYLLHYSIILRLLKYILHTEDVSQVDIYMYTSLYMVATIVFAYFLYVFFEKPMMDIRDRSFIVKKFNKY